MNKKLDKISRMILAYLRKNLDAGDTLEGITNIWTESGRLKNLCFNAEKNYKKGIDELRNIFFPEDRSRRIKYIFTHQT